MSKKDKKKWVIYKRDTTEIWVLGETCVVFDGPGCEALSTLFLRAQMMDELVEAAKAVEAASDGKGFWSDAMIKIRTALAKIDGKP